LFIGSAWPGPLGLVRRAPNPRAGKRIEHPAQNSLHVRKDGSHHGTVLADSAPSSANEAVGMRGGETRYFIGKKYKRGGQSEILFKLKGCL
jgi:hypothetical protein